MLYIAFLFYFQAFGTMGILFPLVIPTICELESAQGGQCRVDIIIQAAAAIMASSIFGNGKIDWYYMYNSVVTRI
jgi:hypothetical protein